MRKKLTSRAALLKRLAGSSWGAGASTLRTAALALVYSTAEYCAPAWCCCAHCHNIDTAIHGALRTVTGCLRPTPLDNLSVLAGIQPAEFRREEATLSLVRRALAPDHLLHSKAYAKRSGDPRRLKSRHPFVPAAQMLLDESNNQNISVENWADYKWSAEWKSNTTRLHSFIPNIDSQPAGVPLPRQVWVRLNRLHTGVGLFRSVAHKWGLATSPSCTCCAEEQTADHIINSCATYRPPRGEEGLRVLDDETRQWLTSTDLDV